MNWWASVIFFNFHFKKDYFEFYFFAFWINRNNLNFSKKYHTISTLQELFLRNVLSCNRNQCNYRNVGDMFQVICIQFIDEDKINKIVREKDRQSTDDLQNGFEIHTRTLTLTHTHTRTLTSEHTHMFLSGFMHTENWNFVKMTFQGDTCNWPAESYIILWVQFTLMLLLNTHKVQYCT